LSTSDLVLTSKIYAHPSLEVAAIVVRLLLISTPVTAIVAPINSIGSDKLS
jgi:hypothetical protein